MRSLLLMLFVLLRLAEADKDGDSYCPWLDCCDEECCGNGTSYSEDGNCIPDPNSAGWEGQYTMPYEEGCAYRMCCEGACCAPGTVYDTVTAYCVPNGTVPLFPLQDGTVVVTCHSGQGSRIGAPEFIVGIIDVRNPVCNAPAPFVGGPDNWFAPMFHNEPAGPTKSWTKSNLGGFEVFGLALDDEQAPNIYVLPTIIYVDTIRTVNAVIPAPQEVWKLDGTTGLKTVLATLPTGNDATNPHADKGVGLGQIAYHRGVKNLYVTSFADGWIYRIDAATGSVLSTFDPLLGPAGSAYNPMADTGEIIGLSDRVWGVQVDYISSRLYYGTWVNWEIDNSVGGTLMFSSVWSVELDADGEFVASSEQMEVDLAITSSLGRPISDIAFSADGNSMVVSERSFGGGCNAHNSGVYRFNRGTVGGPWTLHTPEYVVGAFHPGYDSSGGVDFSDCVPVDACNSGDLVMATADSIRYDSPDNFIYGLMILPAGGGGRDDSYAVDFNGDMQDFGDKFWQGDVEVVRSCVGPPGYAHPPAYNTTNP